MRFAKLFGRLCGTCYLNSDRMSMGSQGPPRQSASCSHSSRIVSVSGNIHDGADAGVNVAVAEGLLQRRKRWLPRAVADGEVIQLPLIVQGGGNSLQFGIRRSDKMEPSKQNPHMRIYFGRSFQDLLHARMRTSIHNDQTLRAANRHRDFAEFQRAGDL